MRLLKIATACAALLSAPVAGQQFDGEWARISSADSGTVVWARAADINAGRSHHTAARVWVKYDASRDRTVTWSEAKALYTVNCPAQTYRALSYSTYRANGSVSYSDDRVGEIRHVIPDSTMGSVVSILCYDPSDGAV